MDEILKRTAGEGEYKMENIKVKSILLDGVYSGGQGQ